VAAGERLDFQQPDITFVGDAIEVRVNAWHEDLSPVLGGVVQALRLQVPAALRDRVRLDASGLLQRQQPWIVPSYDANFALLIVSGPDRHATLEALLAVLDTGLHIQGNAELHTNVQPVIGLLTLMRALPPETAWRTDTSLVWAGLAAVVEMQKHHVLSQIPAFPRRPGAHNPAVFARLLRETLETGLAHPSRLLAYYLKRLTQPARRPRSALEVLWQLAEELGVPTFAEERAQGTAFRQAIDQLWAALAGSEARVTALLQAAANSALEQQADFCLLRKQLVAEAPELAPAEATALLQEICDWLNTDIPAITTLVTILESTQLHALLTVNDDLSVTRPAYLHDPAVLTHLHRLLSKSLRPAVLRHGELLSPMEATIYHQPEPGAPYFVQIGEEITVGQTLALLEAMKMFSELPSPVDGVLLEVLVENGQGVKTGTPLFKIAIQDDAGETPDNILPGLVPADPQNRFRLLRPLVMPSG
jgi:acetyl-CoA carboxylase biotin carboxyl carrier protein